MVLLQALAVWRLTSLLVYEEGPFEMFVKLRDLNERIKGPLNCFWCASMWVAAVVALVYTVTWKDRTILWLALSALACFFDEVRMVLVNLGIDDDMDDDV